MKSNMFRFSSRINALACRKAISPWKEHRLNQHTQSQSSGHVKKALIIGGVTTVVTGGFVGYSAWSPENRKFVEDNIPGSSYVLDPILGTKKVVEPKKVEKPKPASVPKSDVGLLQKKLEREKIKEKDAQAKSTSGSTSVTPLPPPPPPPLQPPPPPQQAKKKEDDFQKEKPAVVPIVKEEKEKKVPSSDDIEQRLATSEKAANDENASLTQEITSIIKEAQALVTEALNAAEKAANAVKSHAEKAYAAIDSGEGHESLYAVCAEVAKAKKELVKTAETKMLEAKEKIKKLQDEITIGKGSKLTEGNSLLTSAEETLSELNYALSKISSTVAEALRDTTAVNEFKNLVEASRTQFEAEVRSLLPDVKIGEKSDKLTTEELNLLLAHAHRKTVDKERYKDSILRQREMETRLLDGKLQSELERQRRDLGLEHRHRLQQLKDDMETELRTQLKRQAAAHSDHLADMLHLQESQLESKWETKLQNDLHNESSKYYMSLSEIQGDLMGLKSALKSRADADTAARAAHELWLACESLKTALRLGKENSYSWEDQLLPLSKQIQSINDAAGDKDPFVKTVISSIPDEALCRGVYTEEALRERFLKVDRICRRVALIGDNGGSLLRYLVSYVQSFFLLGAYDRIPASEIRDEEIDIDQLDTHDILARVRYCIAKDDLLQAVKYLNLLRGEPRIVASDWLKEAKLTLEARQAANALMAHAAATGARAL
ncbi:MICOS complex subunit Mic60 [Armadillidium nasatum]|uniref:MICOS complex subunit MIC60 n=1 Tax=Armadillidium nasatum TaxID=96803 RepID=A0A5N5TL55_9CRUS|nr:MICOS complex subunit Mic60 [Armadillidium nasatum]